MSLRIGELYFSYGAHTVLRGVSFEAHPGEVLGVLGPNGVGKTTLFRCILGLQNAFRGQIFIDEQNVRTISARELANRLAYIPQIHSQNFNYTVLEMVLMGTSHRLSPFSLPRAHETTLAMESLERMGIANLAENSYGRISGGEQQLTLIARALAQESKILLMDEPTAMLDYGNQIRILQVVRSLADSGYTVVLSTHNPQHALWFADRSLALFDGRVEALGASTEVLTDQLIAKLYNLRVQLLPSARGPMLVPLPMEELC